MSVHDRRRHYRARKAARKMRQTAEQLRWNPGFLKRELGKKGHERRDVALRAIRGAPTAPPPAAKPAKTPRAMPAASATPTITSPPTTKQPRAPKVSRSQKEREARRAARRAKKSDKDKP